LFLEEAIRKVESEAIQRARDASRAAGGSPAGDALRSAIAARATVRGNTDYYPPIARAIAGLDPSAPGESRRALYERGRRALIDQLRSVQPPLSESEITRERVSLENAVRKVESEAAQRARDASRAAGGSRDGDAFRSANAARDPVRDNTDALVAELERLMEQRVSEETRGRHSD
jgi:hypothetical protein